MHHGYLSGNMVKKEKYYCEACDATFDLDPEAVKTCGIIFCPYCGESKDVRYVMDVNVTYNS